MDAKNTALFKGVSIAITFEDESKDAVKVLQIPIRSYEAGFQVANDEVALVGFLCGKNKAWAETLTPESYEAVLEKGKEVNEKGFFAFFRRRSEREAKEREAMVNAMAKLPPEVIEMAVKSTSPKLSQPVRPRPELP